jgi:hypothetical protein
MHDHTVQKSKICVSELIKNFFPFLLISSRLLCVERELWIGKLEQKLNEKCHIFTYLFSKKAKKMNYER